MQAITLPVPKRHFGFMRINARLAGGAPVNVPLQVLRMEQGALLGAIQARVAA